MKTGKSTINACNVFEAHKHVNTVVNEAGETRGAETCWDVEVLIDTLAQAPRTCTIPAPVGVPS